MEMSKAITMRLRFLVSLLIQLKYMVMVTLTRLGLSKPAEEAFYSGERNSTTTANNNYVLMSDGSSPSLVPVPVPLVTASIKKTLPVIQFFILLERRGDLNDADEDEDKVSSCAVCWDCINMSHQIRDLSNCCHVFHRECLDSWVDEGRVTCPLCRSMLLPAKTNPWLVLRNAHLSAQPEPEPVQLQITGTT